MALRSLIDLAVRTVNGFLALYWMYSELLNDGVITDHQNNYYSQLFYSLVILTIATLAKIVISTTNSIQVIDNSIARFRNIFNNAVPIPQVRQWLFRQVLMLVWSFYVRKSLE